MTKEHPLLYEWMLFCLPRFHGESTDENEQPINHINGCGSTYNVSLVEVGRIELPSESALTGTSPGAEGYCEDPKSSVSFRTGKPSSLSIR